MLEAFRQHAAERAAEGIPPKPLDAQQTAELVELLKNPPAGEEQSLLELLTQQVPAGVDAAAYVKAGFLAAIARGETTSPLDASRSWGSTTAGSPRSSLPPSSRASRRWRHPSTTMRTAAPLSPRTG